MLEQVRELEVSSSVLGVEVRCVICGECGEW